MLEIPHRRVLVARIRLGLLAAIAALSVGVRPAQAQNLVSNPGFETGDVSGWSRAGTDCADLFVANNSIYAAVGLLPAHTGTYGLLAGPVGGVCTLSQSIATTTGQMYSLQFWLSNQKNGVGIIDQVTPNVFNLLWGGATLLSYTDAPAFAYTQEQFAVVGGPGAATLLAFQFREDPSFWALDDVSVTVTPEPATITLMATGLVGIVGAGLRRRKTA